MEKVMKHRKGLSEKDRNARSQLRQLLERADGVIHGSLIRMSRKCGNPGCRCTLKGQKHSSWCLGVSIRGKTRMKHIPQALETDVRRWVQQYQRARQLIEEMSQQAWHRLSQPKE
jgi:hypothetical protein